MRAITGIGVRAADEYVVAVYLCTSRRIVSYKEKQFRCSAQVWETILVSTSSLPCATAASY